jgi:ankyrin repeat protein
MALTEADGDLWLAAMTGDTDAATAALASGANPDVRNPNHLTPLVLCAGGIGSDDAPMMALLLAAGADPNCADKAGWTPLIFVASCGALPMIELLLAHARTDRHAVTSDRGWTALTRASYRGHAAAVRRLLEAGLRADATTEGRTPLQWAEAHGHADAAQVLRDWLAASASCPCASVSVPISAEVVVL